MSILWGTKTAGGSIQWDDPALTVQGDQTPSVVRIPAGWPRDGGMIVAVIATAVEPCGFGGCTITSRRMDLANAMTVIECRKHGFLVCETEVDMHTCATEEAS